ncbi:unnamed protein product [Brassica oleracea]|uniref:(rape) hypothetical protein n=1 Tax=Brassica napus TaxID=3708 RepID=A0A816IGY5_BRANA|nr:unnamed protein product [Brassica napus]
MFRSMKAQDDEAHLEYEFARYLVRMAAMRCESKRIWCRDYINGKGTLHLRNWLWIKYYNQIVEDRLLVFVFLLKQLLRLESRYCFSISMLYFGDLFGSFTMVLTMFNDSMYCFFFNQKELAQIFERVKSLDLHPTEPWQFQAFDYSFMQLSCSD